MGRITRCALIWVPVWCIVISAGYAQPYVSKHGKFEVDQQKGCAPFRVHITVRPPFDCTGQACAIDPLGNDQFINLVSPFQYDTPGTYWLRLLIGGSGGQDDVDSIQVTVYPNIKPAFEVYTCGNNEVALRITDTHFNQYLVAYDDGTTVTLPATNKNHRHTFAAPGAHHISVRGLNTGAADNCSDSTQIVNVAATVSPPTISRVSVLDPTRVELIYNRDPNVLYRLEVSVNGTGTFQPLSQPGLKGSTETVSNLQPDTRYYCFRLAAIDACTQQAYYSNIVCTADVELDIANNVNLLSWETHAAGIVTRRVRRVADGNTLTVQVGGNTFADNDVTCGTEYCYEVILDYGGGVESVSLQKCGTAISTDTPTTLRNVTASVAQGGVSLTWQTVPGFVPAEFSIYRAAERVGQTASTTFYHEPLEESMCYQVSYLDVCGNTSALSAPACPVMLSASLQDDNTITLTWTPYEGWNNGVDHYVLEKYSLQGQLLQSIQAGSGLSFHDDEEDPVNQGYIYIIRAVPAEAGVVEAVSNPVTAVREPNLFYPTGFTPNGDNLNDHFSVFGQYISGFRMSIFNRWGELLYTTQNLTEGWDGSYNGRQMPEGTYTFVAEIIDFTGRSYRKSGSFFLLQKGK